MILTWLNNNNGCLYSRFYNSYIFTEYYVGFVNSYNHEVVSMYIIVNSIFYNVSSYNDYLEKISISHKENKLLTFLKDFLSGCFS